MISTKVTQHYRPASSCLRPGKQARRRALRVFCSTQGEAQACRRDVLIAGTAALVSPLIIVKGASAEGYIKVENLGSFQRAGQREEFRLRAEKTLIKYVNKDDAAAAVRLVLHDAGTYDAATNTGGMDGSIILSSDELGRPENSTLRDYVEKLRQAKKEIDENDKTGAGPISWADLMYLAGKVTTQNAWYDIKVQRAGNPQGGNLIAAGFRTEWPVTLGRVDTPLAGPNKVPALDAPVEEIKDYLLGLGAKPEQSQGWFAPKPPFWEKPGWLVWTAASLDPAAEEERFSTADPVYVGIKKGYDISRKTVTRTEYEVDFITAYNKLSLLGAKINPTAYLYAMQSGIPKLV